MRFLKEYKGRWGFLLYAYALLPNHIHLLIEARETSLAKVMQTLQFRYTRNFNLKYKTYGHLFQGRYKAILCEKGTYFLELSAYIHLNPVRAELVKDPANYPWSSYPAYVSAEEEGLIDRDFLYEQFSRQKSAARRAYAAFVGARLGEGHRGDFYKTKDQRFLGPEKFIEGINRKLKEKASFKYKVSLDEVSRAAASALNIPKGLLGGLTRSRQGAWGRAVVAYLARKVGGYSLKEVGKHFNRDPVLMSKGVRKVEDRMAAESHFVGVMEALENTLIKGKKRMVL